KSISIRIECIPYFSERGFKMRLARQDVPTEQTWDLTDLFPSGKAWEKELAKVQEGVMNVTAFKGKLNKGAATLLRALEELEALQERLARVGTYAFLRISVDGANPETQAQAAKNAAAMAAIDAELSFFKSELLSMTADTIESFFAQEEKLQKYKKMLDDILEKKTFALAPDMEETLA